MSSSCNFERGISQCYALTTNREGIVAALFHQTASSSLACNMNLRRAIREVEMKEINSFLQLLESVNLHPNREEQNMVLEKSKNFSVASLSNTILVTLVIFLPFKYTMEIFNFPQGLVFFWKAACGGLNTLDRIHRRNPHNLSLLLYALCLETAGLVDPVQFQEAEGNSGMSFPIW